VIVPRPIVLETCHVVLPPCEVEGVTSGRAGDRRGAIWLVGVRRRYRTRGVGQGYCASQHVGQEVAGTGPVRARKVLISASPLRRLATGAVPASSWTGLTPSYRNWGGGPVDSLPLPTTQAVVAEGGRHGHSINGAQPVPRVPGVRIRAVAREIAVGIGS